MAVKRQGRKADDKRARLVAYALLAIVLTASLAYSIMSYGGPSNFGDDNAYAGIAYSIVKGQFSQSGYILSVRILQTYPIAFFYWLTNFSFYSNSAWDIISYMASIVIVFYLGKELYNEYAGVLASFLLMLFPMMAVLSVTMSDNPPMVMLVSLAMLGLLYGTRHNSGKWYAVSGMAFVGSALVIPLGLIGMAVGILYIITESLRGKTKRNALMFVAGIVVAVAVLAAFNYVNSGNPAITYTTTSNFYSSTVGPNTIVPANTNFKYYFGVMFPYKITSILWENLKHLQLNPITIWNELYIVNYSWVGFYFYIGVIAVLYLLYKKERRAYFPMLWLATGFLLMEFDPLHVSLVPFSYMLQHRLDRYLTLIGPPLVLLISMALFRFSEATKSNWKYVRRCIAIAIIAFMVATAIPEINLYNNMLHVQEYGNMQIAKYLSGLPNGTRIYIDSGQFVPVYMGFSNYSRFYIYDQLAECGMIKGNSYIVLPRYTQLFNLTYTPNPSEYCPSWRLVLQPNLTRNYSIAVTGPSMVFNTDLYYVPSNSS
ncbi:MAG: ArnT family glycosyltransferase [Candidatus Micrarchaeaceae archaeon]